MTPQTFITASTGASAWFPLDWYQTPMNVGIGVEISATATYTVEITFDDIFDSTVTPVAFPVSGLTAATTNATGNIAFPVRAIRLNVAANTGTVKITVLQGRTY